MLIKILIIFFTFLIGYQLFLEILTFINQDNLVEGLENKSTNEYKPYNPNDPNNTLILAQQNAGNIEFIKGRIDDLDGVKLMFDFLPNKQFISLGKDYLDLYAMSMCEHNIICNSTFGWWGAYLNENKDKKIIGPNNWFGPASAFLNSSDILPDNWIKI
jgi:hypothetical protein